MTKKIKRVNLLILGFLLLLSVALSVFLKSVGVLAQERADAVKHGPSSLEVATGDDGYVMTGTIGRDRAGFIIPSAINHRHELTFDYTLLIDSGEELADGAPQNRAYIITLNEYPDSDAPYTANNTHISSEVNGLQLEIRSNPYNKYVTVGIMAHNVRIWEENPSFHWQGGHAYGQLDDPSNELYNYLYSALYQKEYNGVLAKPEIRVSFYPSDKDGNKVNSGNDTHYAFSLTPYIVQTGELYEKSLIITANKNYVSENGDFTKTPNLGFYVINEPSTTKVIDIIAGYKNIYNGRIKSVSANHTEIPALKQGEPVQIQVTLIPHNTQDDLSDVTWTFESMDESIATVSKTGVVNAVAKRGGTYILITTSEGNTLVIPVRIFDDVAPVITLDESIPFPERTTQYSEVIIPKFTATDDSGEVEIYLELISPTGKKFDLEQEVLRFVPTNGGDYLFEYSAVDPSGNKASILKTMRVDAGTALVDWVKYESFNSSAKLIENEDYSIDFSGEVGTMESQTPNQAVAWYNNPITFTRLPDGSYETVEFSYHINYSLGTTIVSDNSSERNRFFGMYLVEATSDNTVGPERFDWNTPGIQLIIGKRDTVSDDALVWYELRSGTTQLSRQHTTVIDAGADASDSDKAIAQEQRNGAYSNGLSYMPWFEDGDARNLATKFSTGETINVKIEYIDADSPKYESRWNGNYFILTLDQLSFRIPANLVAGEADGFTRQAYLGFKQYSSNGIIPFDVHISKITNGNVRRVGFDGGDSSVRKLGEEFNINAVSYDNNGNIMADSFTYSSGNEKIANVDETGNVKINAVGSTNIVVTSKNTGKVGVYSISVDIDSFNFMQNQIILYLGQDKQLELIVSPDVEVPFSFVSENPRIVAALNTGKLQAVKLGETTVTVSYMGHVQTCNVRVVTKEEYLALGYAIDEVQSGGAGCNSILYPGKFAPFLVIVAVGLLFLNYRLRSGKE